MKAITIIKRDADGVAELSYSGVLHQQGDGFVCIDAVFSLPDRDLGFIQLRRGDHFQEWFYVDRWFNIFRVSGAGSLALKGWYCNITRPPRIEAQVVAAEDLCLDLFVYPDGRTLLLDEDDFAGLRLCRRERECAWAAVATIKRMVKRRQPPFDEIHA